MNPSFWPDILATSTNQEGDLWQFLPVGYLMTVALEIPILVLGLPKLSMRDKLICGVWLTACTYPIVVLVLPTVLSHWSRMGYLFVAESFAPAAECFLFWLANVERNQYHKRDWLLGFAVITLANVASFVAGELLWQYGLQA